MTIYENLPKNIQNDIKQFVVDNNIQVEIKNMSRHQLLEAYLQWNGIQGYTTSILRICGVKPDL